MSSSSIKSVMSLDIKPTKSALKEIEKYYNETYDDMVSAVGKVTGAEKSLTAAIKKQADEKEKVSKASIKASKDYKTAQANAKKTLEDAKDEVTVAKEKVDQLKKQTNATKEIIKAEEEVTEALKKQKEAKKDLRDIQVEGKVAYEKELNIAKELHAEAVKATSERVAELNGIKGIIAGTKGVLSVKKEEMAVKQKSLDLANKELEAQKKIGAEKAQMLAKEQFAQKTKDPLTKEVWDTKDLKNYYSTLEKESKKSLDLANKELEAQKKIGAEKAKEIEKEISAEKKEYRQKYINTKATNNYEVAVERLNHQRKIGAISQYQYNTALKKEKLNHKEAELATKQHTKSTESLANQTIRYLRWAGTIAGVLYATKRAWDATLGTGIEVNKIIESNTFGIAALISANTRMEDSQGRAVTSAQKFIIAQTASKEALSKIKKESLDVGATFKEMTEVYQQMIGNTMSAGDAFGDSVEKVGDNTIKLSKRLISFAEAIGMPLDRVREEARSLTTANASTDSLIASIVFGSPSEANKAIRKAKESTDGMTKLFDKMFSPFDVLAGTRSYTKGLAQAKGAYEIMVGDMVKKSEMFSDITDMFYKMSDSIKDGTDDIVESFDSMYETAGDIVDVLSNFVVPATAITSFSLMAGAVKILTESTKALTAAALLNPYIAGAAIIGTGAYTIAGYLEDEAERLDDVSGVIDNSLENIYKQSIEKIKKDRKLLDEEIGKQAKKVGIFQQDVNVEYLGESFMEGSNHKEVEKKELKVEQDNLSIMQQRYKYLGLILKEKLKEKKVENETLERAKEKVTLIANIAINKKIQEDIDKQLGKSEDKILTLTKTKKVYTDDLVINKKKLIVEQNRYAKEIKAGKKDIITIMALEKAIAKDKEGIADSSNKIAKIQHDKQAKSLKIKNDLWLAEQNMMGIEVKKSDMLERDYLRKADEVLLAKEGEERDKRLTEYYAIIAKYNKEITDEKEKQAKANKAPEIDYSFGDIEDSQSDMLQAQLDLVNATQDWGTELDGVAGKMQDLSKSIMATVAIDLQGKKSVADLDEKYYKESKKISDEQIKVIKTKGVTSEQIAKADVIALDSYNKIYIKHTEDEKKLKQQQQMSEIAGYGQIAGAVSQMYEEGSKEAKAALMMQQALAVVNGVATVLNVGTSGDGYSALARVAAAIGVVGSVLAMANIGFGGSSSESSVDTIQDTIDSASYRNGYGISLDDYGGSFDDFMDGLDSASEKLKDVGNEGSATAESLSILKNTFEKAKDDYEEYKSIDALDPYSEYNIGDMTDEGFIIVGNVLAGSLERMNKAGKLYYDELSDSITDNIDWSVYSNSEAQDIISESMQNKTGERYSYASPVFDIDYADELSRELADLNFEYKNALLDKSTTDDELQSILDDSFKILNNETYKAIKNFPELADALREAREESNANIETWKYRNETEEETAKRMLLQLDEKNILETSSEEAMRNSIDAIYDRALADEYLDDAEMEALMAAEHVLNKKISLEDTLLRLGLSTNELRELDIKSIDKTNQALQREIWAKQDAIAVSDEKISLEDTLLKLGLSTNELRELDIKSIDKTNQALQREIWAREDLFKIQAYDMSLLELEKSLKDELNDATINAMKSTKDFADSLDSLAHSSDKNIKDMATSGMSSKESEFYYLTEMNKSKALFNEALSSGEDYKYIEKYYSDTVDSINSLGSLNIDYNDSLINSIEDMNMSLFDAEEILKVQLVGSDVDVTGLTSTELAEIGLATDTNISAQEYFDNLSLATTLDDNARDYFDSLGLATDENVSAIEYYNNSGLATDENINLQEYYNNSGLALDSTISAQEYFDNLGLSTTLDTNTRDYFDSLGLATDENVSAIEYYNNSGLATDANMDLQKYYDNKDLAKDGSLVSSAEPYSLSSYLKTLITAQKEALIHDTKDLSGESYGVGYTLGKTEQSEFNTTAGIGADTDELYKFLSALNNAGTQQEDFTSLEKYLNIDKKTFDVGNKDSFDSLKALSDAGYTTDDFTALLTGLSGAQKDYANNQDTIDFYENFINVKENKYKEKILGNVKVDPANNSTRYTDDDEDSTIYSNDNSTFAEYFRNIGLDSSIYINSDKLKKMIEEDLNKDIEWKDKATLEKLKEKKFTPQFKSGGYTGNYGVDEVAGIVHGQEFVVDAPTTKSLGLNDNSGGIFKDMLKESMEQNKLLNGIISEQKKQVQVMQESRDINNETLVKVTQLEEAS